MITKELQTTLPRHLRYNLGIDVISHPPSGNLVYFGYICTYSNTSGRERPAFILCMYIGYYCYKISLFLFFPLLDSIIYFRRTHAFLSQPLSTFLQVLTFSATMNVCTSIFRHLFPRHSLLYFNDDECTFVGLLN